MGHRALPGAARALVLSVSIMSALWSTFNHGGRFFERSEPILADMLYSSQLWLWSDLIIGLWFWASWAVFFMFAAITTDLLLSLLVGWLMTRFF